MISLARILPRQLNLASQCISAALNNTCKLSDTFFLIIYFLMIIKHPIKPSEHFIRAIFSV